MTIWMAYFCSTRHNVQSFIAARRATKSFRSTVALEFCEHEHSRPSTINKSIVVFWKKEKIAKKKEKKTEKKKQTKQKHKKKNSANSKKKKKNQSRPKKERSNVCARANHNLNKELWFFLLSLLIFRAHNKYAATTLPAATRRAAGLRFEYWLVRVPVLRSLTHR